MGNYHIILEGSDFVDYTPEGSLNLLAKRSFNHSAEMRKKKDMHSTTVFDCWNSIFKVEEILLVEEKNEMLFFRFSKSFAEISTC